MSRRPEVRDVVALDAERRLLEAELIRQLRERARARAEVGGAAELVPVERLLGVARHDLEELALRAALGNGDPDRAAPPAVQPRLEQVAIGRLAGTSTRGGTSCRSM